MRHILCSALLVACAEGASDPIDTPPSDPPRPEVQPPSGEVEPPDPERPAIIQVAREGAPVGGAWVVFHDPDGTPREVTMTGDDGEASATIEPGSMVTVAEEGGSLAVTTYGVDPGDHVVVALDSIAIDPSAGAVRARLPGVFAGASRYTIDLGCNSETVINPSPPYTVPLQESCLTGGNANVFATARDGSGAALAWSFAGPITADGTTAQVTLPAWSDAWRQVSVELRDAPAGARSVRLGGEWIVSAAAFPAADQPFALLSAGGDVTLTTRIPDATADGFASRTVIAHSGQTALSGLSERYQRFAEVPATISLGMESDFLPGVTMPSLDLATPSRPAIGWSAGGSLAGADLGRIALAWNGASGVQEWIAIVPPTASAPIAMPEMPEELAAFRPVEGAGFGTPQVSFFDADWIDGYATIKTAGFEPDLPPSGAHTILSSTALNP